MANMTLTRNWINFKIEIISPDLPEYNDASVLNWIDSALQVHQVNPVIDFDFHDATKIFRIRFVDGRVWKMKFLLRAVNSPTTYDLNPATEWDASMVVGIINPCIVTTLNLYATYGLINLEAVPRP